MPKKDEEQKFVDKTIIVDCKKCLKKISMKISAKEQEAKKYPIKLEDVHGDPPHQLIVYVGDKLEVLSFEIYEKAGEKRAKTSKFTEEVLRNYGLNDKEIKLHIVCSGLGPVTVGEMSRLANIPPEEIEMIAKKFVEKGFFKEIIGGRTYYQALPPYPALKEQLTSFSVFIADIKNNTPTHLADSFKKFENQAKGVAKLNDFVGYLNNLNKIIADKIVSEKAALEDNFKLLDQQKNINTITDLQEKTKNLLRMQFESLDKQVNASLSQFDVKFSQLEKSLDDNIKSFDDKINSLATRLDGLQAKISRNLNKLRLGLVQKVVEDVLRKTFLTELKEIKKSFKGELIGELERMVANLKHSFASDIKEPMKNIVKESRVKFQSDFEKPFGFIIETVSNQINASTKGASQIGENLKTAFNKIVEEFDHTIAETQGKITGISDEVLQSFNELRGTFSKTVISTLDDTLGKVKERVDISSQTVDEFWEDAKASVTQKMKDVWFIRTPEGMKSQINDSLARAKMRVLINAPSLSEIEIEPILKLPEHINIRICCSIDPSNKEHFDMLTKLESRHNITLRARDLQNLWGINRDYEEVILGIVSKELGPQGGIELVGIGSYLQEHIKMLVPILEEAWMNSRKDYGKGGKAEPDLETTKPATKTFIKEQTSKSPTIESAPITNKPSEPLPEVHTLPQSENLPKIDTQPQHPTSAPKKFEHKPPILSQTKPEEPSLAPQLESKPESIVEEQTKGKEEPKASPELISDINGRLDKLATSIQGADPKKLSQEISDLRDYIFEKKGFSVILNDMKNWASQVKSKGSIDEPTAKLLSKRIAYWKESLFK